MADSFACWEGILSNKVVIAGVRSSDAQRMRDQAQRRSSSNQPSSPHLFDFGVEALESRQMLSGGTISGNLFNDVNADHIWNAGDTRLSGWTVYLDLQHTGQLAAGDPSTTTDANGFYQFTGLAAGTYTVSFVEQSGFTPSAAGTSQTVAVAANQAVTGVVFGETSAAGQISGTVLDSDNGQPLANFGVYIDLNNSGHIEAGDPWTSTNAQGQFTFSQLIAGTYTIRTDPQEATWTATSANGGWATVVSDGLTASAPLSFSFTANAPPASYQVNQLVDYQLIGGSGGDASTRMVGSWFEADGGWTGFVNSLQADLAWGVKRVELHNPFGTLPTDTYYTADQYLEAQAAGLTWLTDNFVSAWKPITASGVEVIAYIGNPDLDPSFQALVNDPTAWMARFDASVAPFVQAGMSIAFDCGQQMTDGDLFYQAIEGLQAQGVKVYLENRPAEAEAYTWNFPIIATNGWDDSNPYSDPSTFSWAVKNSQLPPGNVLQLFQTAPAGGWTSASLISALQAVLYTGDSAGIDISTLRQLGITMQELLTPPATVTTTPPATPPVTTPPVTTPVSSPTTPTTPVTTPVSSPPVASTKPLVTTTTSSDTATDAATTSTISAAPTQTATVTSAALTSAPATSSTQQQVEVDQTAMVGAQLQSASVDSQQGQTPAANLSAAVSPNATKLVKGMPKEEAIKMLGKPDTDTTDSSGAEVIIWDHVSPTTQVKVMGAKEAAVALQSSGLSERDIPNAGKWSVGHLIKTTFQNGVLIDFRDEQNR